VLSYDVIRVCHPDSSSKSRTISLFPSSLHPPTPPVSLHLERRSPRYPSFVFLASLQPSHLPTFKPSSIRHRDENPVTVTSLECALANRDAYKSFIICTYKNCRVSPTIPAFLLKYYFNSRGLFSVLFAPTSKFLLFVFSVLRTLSFYVCSKSFVCRSYENCRGVSGFFPFWKPFSSKCALAPNLLPPHKCSSLRVTSHQSSVTFSGQLALTFLLSPHTILSSTRGWLSLLRAATNPKLPHCGQRISTGGRYAHQGRYQRLRPYRS